MSENKMDALDNLLDTYWSLAHAEGVEGRLTDTQDGLAQKVLSEIRAMFAALQQPEPVACDHRHDAGLITGYDACTCRRCGWIFTDSGWGRASRMWFPSTEAATEFEKYGTYPDMKPTAPPTPAADVAPEQVRLDLLTVLAEGLADVKLPGNRNTFVRELAGLIEKYVATPAASAGAVAQDGSQISSKLRVNDDCHESVRDNIGQAVNDFFAGIDNGDGTIAFDHYSPEDIDTLVNVMLSALPTISNSLSADVMRALTDARDLAMKNTLAARVPECGDFGAIAQNLDWAVGQLAAPAEPAAGDVPALTTERDQFAVPDVEKVMALVSEYGMEMKDLGMHTAEGYALGIMQDEPEAKRIFGEIRAELAALANREARLCKLRAGLHAIAFIYDDDELRQRANELLDKDKAALSPVASHDAAPTTAAGG